MYILLATDAQNGNVTVYWTQLGWTTVRARATGMSKAGADAKLDILSNNLSIIDRFKDMVIIAK